MFQLRRFSNNNSTSQTFPRSGAHERITTRFARDRRIDRINDETVFVEGCTVFCKEDMSIVRSTSKSAIDRPIEILIISGTLRRSSAGRVTAVLPCFSYARQVRIKTRCPRLKNAEINLTVVEFVYIDPNHAINERGT